MSRIAVCVCTYRRNGPLRRLLVRLSEIAAASREHQFALVVADDNPDRSAEAVVAEFASSFTLGVHYLVNGTQNISNGRNLVLAEAARVADLAVMTDDDCVPDAGWIDALVATRDATGADSVTGPMIPELPVGASRWIQREALFAQLDSFPVVDGPMDHGQTNNCLITCEWLRANPDHRFDPALGRLGGEDMVFFRTAVARGMRSWFSAAATVRAVEPMSDLALRALLRTYFWLGNSEAVTNLELAASSRRRLLLRGVRRTASSLTVPLRRVARGRAPHIRSTAVVAARGLGLVSGALGLRVRHH